MDTPGPDDDYEADRPRRGPGRRDDYADRPPPPAAAPTVSVLGVFSFVIGLLSLALSFIPCIGSLAILGGLVGAGLGGIALAVAPGANHGRGLPTAGVVTNVLSIVVAGVWILVLSRMADNANVADVAVADPVKITAAQLSREYQSNVVKADETYGSKVLEVTGQVKLVSKERVGRITVELGGRDDTIDCDFGSATKAELAGVEVGRTVTIRGKCNGVDKRSNFVVLEGCKWLKDAAADPAGPDRVVKVEAARLLKEYDADEEDADRTYKHKVVEVTGEVAEVNDADRKERVVLFRPEDGPHLECRLTPEASRSAGKLRAGQTVTLRGGCAGLQQGEFVLVENATLVK